MNKQERVLMLATSHNDLRSIKALKQMGFYVIATGGKKGLVGEQFVDEYFQMDYSKIAEILKFAESRSIDHICACCNDFGVMTASYVADRLGLSGHDSYENALILHHKDMFKKFARENDIFTPVAEYFSDENSALNYIEIAEYPIIVKASDLSAGNGVSQAENKEQAVIAVKNSFAKSRVKKIVIEPFINGSQHGFCTFLINKKVVAVCSNNEYSFINLYRVEIDTYPADNFAEVRNFLIEQIEKIADILNLKDGIFHLQYIMKDGKPHIIECMRRTLGNMYGVPAEKLTGINWDYWQMAVYCGLDLSDFPKNTEQRKFCAYKTIMAKQNGYVKDIIIPEDINKFIYDTHFLWKPENPIADYMSEPLGFLFMEFSDVETMKNVLLNRYNEIYLEYQKEVKMSRKIEEIRDIAKLVNQDLEYLRNSKLPLVLFGTAELAHAVKSLLDRNNIEIAHIVVDKQFYKPQQYFYEMPITLFENILENEKEFNVIVSFSPAKYPSKIEELKKIKQVKRYIFFDTFQPFDFDFDFINTHYSIFEKLFFKFQDDLSRNVFLEFIKAKNLKNSNELVKLNVSSEEQYFPSFLRLNENETFVDCGAFDGDTVLRFVKYAKGNFNKIYAFECDEKNAQKFLSNTEQYKNKIEFVKKGAWSKASELYFSNAGSSGSRVEESGTKIIVDSIDNIAGNEPVSFIKMDIEGAELEALRGAENTIRKYKPKLAICVYHKQEDLISIPQYILSLHNDYKFYLRHYDVFVTELVLYAI